MNSYKSPCQQYLFCTITSIFQPDPTLIRTTRAAKLEKKLNKFSPVWPSKDAKSYNGMVELSGFNIHTRTDTDVNKGQESKQ